MQEIHTPISIKDYFSCLIDRNCCLVEQDGQLYKAADFYNILQHHESINVDEDCFYECCQSFMKSYHYSAKLGWSRDADSEKKCIAVVYW